MRIGLFTDAYLPTINGISFVVQITQKRLEELGHEVYIFAPSTNLRLEEPGDEPHVIRFRGVEGVFFDEQLTSVFFPPTAIRKIRKLNLDIIHFMTPSQIGLMGVYTAIREDIPLVSQYSTDLFRYVEEYPNVLPGTIALALTAPWMLKLTPRQIVRMLAVFRPKKTVTAWHKSIVARMHTVLHNHCDAVIALSKKMQKQLDSWGSETISTILPNGINALPSPSRQECEAFAKNYGLKKDDKVLLSVGRLSREKNLDLLIKAFKVVAAKDKTTKLMFVGDFDYREELEEMAKRSGFGDRVIFTGMLERQKLGVAYESADIFLFPSQTDTQGLVLNEAAATGLPIILCDEDVSEIFINNQTGILAKNNVKSFADAILKLTGDNNLRKKLGQNAKARAEQFSEQEQVLKLEKLYRSCIENHKKVRFAGSKW